MDKILVVHEDSNERNGLCRLLEHAGYEVRSAADGVEALQKVRNDNFDLMLLDIWMTRMDGLELLAQLGTPLKVRQERLGHSDPHITHAIYTHVASEDSRRVAAQLGEVVWGILDANGRRKENGSGVEPPKPFVIN
jgi:CheY-like chemotaxis protein